MGTVSGRRKEATAVVKLTKGTGIVTCLLYTSPSPRD